MPVRRTISQTDGVFFITFTCARWLPLFKLVNGYDIVYKWFHHLHSQGHRVVGYVVMPDHLHVVAGFRNTGKLINSIIGNGKRFMAYELVKRLREGKHHAILEQMSSWVNATDAERNKKHEVFEPSFDWKECRTEKFIVQKLNYIHLNPCKAGLAEVPEAYEYSSAKFYSTGEQGAYKVKSYTELQDVDLTAVP